MQSPHASPVSPLFALPELPIHGKVPSPQTQTLALDALTSSFGFPEPPARTTQRAPPSHSAPGSRRTSSGSPPASSGLAARRKQHGSKLLQFSARHSRESLDGALSPRKSPKSPKSPHSLPPMPPSPALPLGAASMGLDQRINAAYYDAPGVQERTVGEETVEGGSREQAGAERPESALPQGEDAKGRIGSIDSQASSASGSRGPGTSRTSGSVIALRTTGLSDRHDSLHPSPALSTSSSSTGELDETLDHEIDGEGTDGSAGALSFSSDGDYGATPVTPATPAMPEMQAPSSASSRDQQQSQWRPRELHLPQRTGPTSERERAIASLTVRSPVVSRSTSPAFAHNVAATAARLSPVTQMSPLKIHTRAAPSTSSASGSAGSGTTLPASGSSGPRGLLLAGAAAPPGSARIKPSLITPSLSSSSLTSASSTPTREPFGLAMPPTPRSPLPVLSSSTPAFPPTPSATVESMAAGRVPNDQLFALPTRPSSNSLSPLSITQGIPSPLGSGSVSPIASAPSWEMPSRDSPSVRDLTPAYSPPATPLEPEAFVARVEAMEQERIKEHSTAASSSATGEPAQPQASNMIMGRARSGSGSFASAAASTRRTNSRRKPPPAPLLLVRIPASPDTAQFSPSARSALPSAMHVFHTPQSSPMPRAADLAEPEADKSSDSMLGSSLRPASRGASPPPTPFFDFENTEEEEVQEELEPKVFREMPGVEEESSSSAETLQSAVEPAQSETEALQGSVETLEPAQVAEPAQSVESVESSVEKGFEAALEASPETSSVDEQPSASDDLLSASGVTSRMASVSSVASSVATGDDAFEFDDGSDDDAAESLMLSGATSELLESIEARPASALSNDSEGGNATDPGASTDSSYSQPSVALGMTPSSSGVSFRTSIFQDMQQSPRVDRFGPRGTPDITRGRVQSQYSSSGSRPPSQSAPIGPPPSGPLPTLPPATPSSPSRARAKTSTSSQGSTASLARVTSYPGLAKSAPALPTQPVPSVAQQRRDSSPPPARPRRPSEGVDLAPPKFAAHLQKLPPTPATAPLPSSEWQPGAQSAATRASMSGPSSPEKGAAPMPHSAPADRLRPDLSVRTEQLGDARPRPPVPIAKRSIVPDVPSFGYMGANQGAESGPVSPIGSGAPPTPSGFSVFSEESSSEHGFVGMSSRWSSGSESDGESKAAAKAKAAKGKKNVPAQRKSMRSSVSAQSGSMPPPAAPATKKPNFLSGFGLRKKNFSNAASGPSSSSLSQRSNSPLTPGMAASSPAPTPEGSYEFPFPNNVTSTTGSAGVSGMPSSWGPNRASQLGNGHERSRSRTGSMVARLSGAGPLLKTKQSNNSLRASSTEANRRPSLSADHLASNGWPTPASASYDSASLYYDSQRRPSLGATSVTGLGIMDGEDPISGVSPTTATAMASAARASQGSRLSSNLRSARASFTNLRASREMSPLPSPAGESPASDSSAMRKRSMPALGSEARVSRQSQLPSIASSRRPSVSDERVVTPAHLSRAFSSDELEETPRVAYASLPGSERGSVGSPPPMNTSRYFHSDAEGLTALGTAFTTWRDDDSLPPSLPTSPTVPIPMRVGSLRKAHQRSHSKSSSMTGASLISGTSSASLASSNDSNATYPGRVLSPPPAPSPRSTSLKRPRRVLEREEISARPRYTSLTDFGRAWQQAHPNAPLEGAVGPKLLAAAIAPRTHGGGQQSADASGATTPSDTTDYYGSSDGGGGGGRDASEGDEQGSSSGSGTGSGGDGKEPNDGNRPVRADVALESSSEESDEYGSDDETTLDANKALDASGLSSRSESSDDVPLGERVQNAAALQKRLRDQERKAQIETARSALERGGRTSKSDRAVARKLLREAPPDASPLNALDLIARLQKVQLMQQQQLEQGAAPSGLPSKPVSSAPQLRAQPGRARANTLRSTDPRAPSASASAPAVPAPPMPSLSPQNRVSPASKTVPLPPQPAGQQRSPGLTQAKLQYMQQQQQLQQQQQQMQNAANVNAAFRSAGGPIRHRPSIGADGQTEHKPPVATMMIPSTGTSPTPSSPAFSTTSLPHSSKMAAVVGQANFPMPPAMVPGLGMQGIPQHFSSTTPSSDGHALGRGGAGMDTAATVAVATARLRSRSVSRARPPQGIDARIAPPLPVSSLARPPQPPQHSSPSPTSGPISPPGSGGVPLPLVSQANEPPRASTESGRPSQGAPSPSSTTASLAPNTQLMQHRVYIATRQRFGTALIAQGGRARDLVLDIMSKEYVPTDATGGGWVVFDCSPEWGIERPLREYEMISDVVDARPTADDYFLLKRTELSPYLSFRAVPTSSPLLAGYVYVQDAKRKWNKRWLELREHSLFHAKSDKGKDEVFICSLSAFDAYLVDSSKIKAPKPHAFAVRSQNKITMFEKQADYIHYFCLGDPAAHRDWVRAILNACTYILKQERAALFVPPVRALNPSSDGPSSAPEAQSRGTDSNMIARSGTTVSHHTPRNVEQRPMRSATMDARVVGAADAGVFTGPFEKGSLLASAAAKQAAQQGEMELSLHERTARARQTEAARRADLADRMRQARAGGQPLIDVAAREGM